MASNLILDLQNTYGVGPGKLHSGYPQVCTMIYFLSPMWQVERSPFSSSSPSPGPCCMLTTPLKHARLASQTTASANYSARGCRVGHQSPLDRTLGPTRGQQRFLQSSPDMALIVETSHPHCSAWANLRAQHHGESHGRRQM